MTNELEILTSVEVENTITQRELAKRTGLSLGAVNILIKRLIHKGLIKIEQINTRTIKYMLTPKGLMEKARLTYKYIIISYNSILNIERKIEQIIYNKKDTTRLILYGEKDELYGIITSKLHAMNEPYQYINDRDKLSNCIDNEHIFITWSPEEIEQEKDRIINILHAI